MVVGLKALAVGFAESRVTINSKKKANKFRKAHRTHNLPGTNFYPVLFLKLCFFP